jgi:hypothetical protein
MMVRYEADVNRWRMATLNRNWRCITAQKEKMAMEAVTIEASFLDIIDIGVIGPVKGT